MRVILVDTGGALPWMDGYTQGHVKRKSKTFYFVYSKPAIFVPDTEKCPYQWLFLLRYLLIVDRKILDFQRKKTWLNRESDAMQKTYSPEFKAKLVMEAMRGERLLNEIVSENNVRPNMLTQWKTDATNNYNVDWRKCGIYYLMYYG